MVTKSKQIYSKFVVITAEEIVRPLIQRFLEGDGSHNSCDESVLERSVSVRGKEVKLVKCPFYYKTSYSAPGLKSHITKRHKLIKMATLKNIEKIRKNAYIYEQANKIVDLIHDDVVDLTNDEEEFIEEI